MATPEDREKRIKRLKRVRKKISGKFVGYVSAALALVAGLAWNDAIGSVIKYYFPLDSNTLLAKLIYAAVLTIIITLVLVYLESLVEDNEE